MEEDRVLGLVLGRLSDLGPRVLEDLLEELLPELEEPESRLVRLVRRSAVDAVPTVSSRPLLYRTYMAHRWQHQAERGRRRAHIFFWISTVFFFLSYAASMLALSCLTIFPFSIANSSSALTLISRAFSRASCLMKAVYRERTAASAGLARGCHSAAWAVNVPSCASRIRLHRL